jgi:3-deoxy-manno-octulosonate cytidylyltransferase (CMP-KDO synthetase)
MKDFTLVIPLRLASKRLKGKPLLKIKGLPIFVHIYYNLADYFKSIYIATADDKIIRACLEYNIPYIKTSSKPRNGSERVAEAVIRGNIRSDIIVNLQGDEVDADPELIEGVIKKMKEKKTKTGTAVFKINYDEIEDPDTVKAVLNRDDCCIFFTRAPIPYFRDKSRLKTSVYRHIGIYGFTREMLLRYRSMDPTYLEEVESLEQMRLIENGIPMAGFITHKNYRKIDNIQEFHKLEGH